MKQTILVVDDEADVIDLVRYNLQKAGDYRVLTAGDGLNGLKLAQDTRPDAIILDVMMPGNDGFEVCRKLRKDSETARIPIIFLTAKDRQDEKIAGLEYGADDYLTKPFSPKELVLRVQALLRRSSEKPTTASLELGEFHLNRETLEFKLSGEKVDLTTTEFKLLSLLLGKRGKILSRETLLQDVWGYNSLMDTRTVDTHIRRLRAKLGIHADRVETIRGEGYRFTTK